MSNEKNFDDRIAAGRASYNQYLDEQLRSPRQRRVQLVIAWCAVLAAVLTLVTAITDREWTRLAVAAIFALVAVSKFRRLRSVEVDSTRVP